VPAARVGWPGPSPVHAVFGQSKIDDSTVSMYD
jgi:hypothetical protein